jgi:hypothetical protein
MKPDKASVVPTFRISPVPFSMQGQFLESSMLSVCHVAAM